MPWLPALPFVSLKDQIAVDDHSHRKPRPDRQRRLNVEIPLNDFLSGLVQAIAGSTTERCDDITIAGGTRGGSKLAADAEQRRQQGSLEQGAPMIVDLVLETGKTGGIGAGLTLQHDRAAVRHDQAGPDQQHARLTEGDLAIVNADQSCPLRYEEEAPGRAVKDVLGHLGRDLARHIGTNSINERSGDHGPSLDHERRSRLRQSVRTGGSSIDRGVNERKFAILTILSKCVVG